MAALRSRTGTPPADEEGRCHSASLRNTSTSLSVRLATPPESPETAAQIKPQDEIPKADMLTPPVTPTRKTDGLRRELAEAVQPMPTYELFQNTGLREFRVQEHSMEIGDSIATGQWSVVKTGRIRGRQNAFAVKIARIKMAQKILAHEARVLTFLSMRRGFEEYVEGFDGYDESLHALVLGIAPTTLELHVKHLLSSDDSLDSLPIHRLERHLVAGLQFLHNSNIIHGDIKPGNILLELGSMKPLYCDFSAARFDDEACKPNDSAGTFEYMAPELFSYKANSDWSTKASDVFALGVTMLFAIVGQAPYQEASGSLRSKVALAMNGDPLSSILASTTHAQRYRRANCTVVEKAMAKATHKRPSATEWLRLLECPSGKENMERETI